MTISNLNFIKDNNIKTSSEFELIIRIRLMIAYMFIFIALLPVELAF
jgi:hypothetical protein